MKGVNLVETFDVTGSTSWWHAVEKPDLGNYPDYCDNYSG
jgi:hypothetical protein